MCKVKHQIVVLSHFIDRQFFRCLTFGLPDETEKVKDEKFDEKEYQRYEDLRSRLSRLFDEVTEMQRSKIQIGTSDEVR